MCEELLVHKALPSLRDNRFQTLPNSAKLAAGLKEEVFMKKAIIQERTGLLPIADHHPGERPAFCPWRCDAHRLIESIHDVVLEEPIACLTQPSLATQIIDLQVQLRLL